MTQKDNGPSPGRNYGEMGVFTFGQKVDFGLEMGFNPKNHPKFLKRLIFIWEKATFFFEQLFPIEVSLTHCPCQEVFDFPEISMFFPSLVHLNLNHRTNYEILVLSSRY